MLRVGLTGGIASGKSRVRARLAERGVATFDLDQVARVVVEPGRPAFTDIVRSFGRSVLADDGRIDRRVLAGIVFADADARAHLNAIVHPRVFEEEERLAAELPPSTRVVVTDATLLVESGYHVRFDRLVATLCRPEQQLERLMARDGLAAADARARVEAQMPAAEKARFAHHVVDTSGSEADTDAAAVALADMLLALAGTWPRAVPLDETPVARLLWAASRGAASGGLGALAVAEVITRHGFPSLPALAQQHRPTWPGAWYERPPSEGALPELDPLLAPVVAWSLGWHAGDLEAMLAAAVSVALVTHRRGDAALVSAATRAVALHQAARAATSAAERPPQIAEHAALIARWAGEPPPAESFAAHAGSAMVEALRGNAGAPPPPPEIVHVARGLVLASSRPR